MSAAKAMDPTPERRREHRVPVQLPILVRGIDLEGDHFEERASSVNLCRGGVAFSTRYALALGDRLQINIPVAPTPSQPDADFATQARVVHVVPSANPRELIIGVEFTGPHFHRMYVSEAT
ncbi:MAG: PilZ domain-containing protein [Acidobacteriia bacterium]|nr:PilZ domain-containing protein [Terriglobia bacterium]